MFDFGTLLLEDLFRAYFDARKNKRNTKSQLAFEFNQESNLIALRNELIDRSYHPSALVCFVVFKPVKREIFASQFKDRVVHHLLYNYIAPVFEKRFIQDSYSCRKEKGTLYGIKRLEHHIRSCSDNYKSDAYVLKMDIQGYFMSINKERLFEIINGEMDKHWAVGDVDTEVPSLSPDFICYLLSEIIFKEVTENMIVKGKASDWAGLPESKCLSHSPKGVGLPIGDLTSQLFSNIYLNVLDQYVKRELKIKHYGRYVDDFFVVHRSKAYLMMVVPLLETFLKQKLGLTLHPQKRYLQHYKRGVLFLGAFVKPYRRHLSERSVKQFYTAFSNAGQICQSERLSFQKVAKLRSVLNSYCGYLGWFKSYGLIKKSVKRISLNGYFYFKDNLRVVSLSYRKVQSYNGGRFF